MCSSICLQPFSGQQNNTDLFIVLCRSLPAELLPYELGKVHLQFKHTGGGGCVECQLVVVFPGVYNLTVNVHASAKQEIHSWVQIGTIPVVDRSF